MCEVVGWAERAFNYLKTVHSERCFNLFPGKQRGKKYITTRQQQMMMEMQFQTNVF